MELYLGSIPWTRGPWALTLCFRTNLPFAEFPSYRPILKNCHETWQVAKVPEVAHIDSFDPRGSKLSWFSLYRQRFPRYRPSFKIAIFGHETLPLAKVLEVAHIGTFDPRGTKLSLILLSGQRFPRSGPIFKICQVCSETSKVAKVPQLPNITTY